MYSHSRSYLLVVLLATIGVTGGVYATPPPTLPEPLPPQLRLPEPPPIELPTVFGPRVNLTVDAVRKMPISPTAANGIIAYLTNAVAAGTSASDAFATEQAPGNIAPPHFDPIRRSSRHGYLPMLDTSIVTPLLNVCCNDDLREQEPTLITNTIGTTDYTITAFMQYPTCCPVTQPNHVLAKRSGSTTPQTLTGVYAANGDPAIAENPYPTTSGIKPDRMYVLATDGASSHFPPSQLSMWYTDDGGASALIGPNIVLTEPVPPPGTHRFFCDKPSIAVSWYPTTLGTVYVAAVRADLDAGTNFSMYPYQLVILRSDDGLTFRKTATLASNGSSYGSYPLSNNVPHSPQIVVDQNTGSVYLFWLEWNAYAGDPQANKIFAAKSDASATGFFMLDSFSAGTFLGPNGPNTNALPDQNGYALNQQSMLNARMNVAAHTIGVVWHARETDGTHSDVFYNALNMTNDKWTGIQTVNHNGIGTMYGNDGRDQWNPALDNDGYGNVMVTYYDRRDDQHLYRMYATKLTATGGHLETQDYAIQRVGPDAAAEPNNTVVTDGAHMTVGEYQDLWYWRDWKGSFIYAPNGGFCGIYHADVNP